FVLPNLVLKPGHGQWTIQRQHSSLCPAVRDPSDTRMHAALSLRAACEKVSAVIATSIFILGLIIGSFLNVCILRIPREESVVLPSSHCTTCNAVIKPYDNIPVVSWLLLGGRCRKCKTRISPLYPIIELLTGLLFLGTYLWFGPTIEFVKWALFAAILVVL